MLRGELSPPFIKFINPAFFLALFACVCFNLRFPYLDFEKNHGSVNASTEPCKSNSSVRHFYALSTSFEKLVCDKSTALIVSMQWLINVPIMTGPLQTKTNREPDISDSVILLSAFLVLEKCVVINSYNASKYGSTMPFLRKIVVIKK